MTKEYIERGALLKALSENSRSWAHYIDAIFVAEKVPVAADVVEVKHGRWEDRPTGRYRQMQSWCTACGKHSGIGGIESNRHKPYCPNCGAKMDGE